MSRIFLPRVLIALALATAIVGGAIGFSTGQLILRGSGLPPDFLVGYDAATLADLFGGWTAADHQLYHRIRMLDIVNPALYGLLLAGLTARLSGKAWMVIPALCAAALDYAENSVITKILSGLPELPEGLVATGNALSLAKFTALGIAVVLLVTVLVRPRT